MEDAKGDLAIKIQTHILRCGGEGNILQTRSVCPEIKPDGIKKFVEWQCARSPENKREAGIK